MPTPPRVPEVSGHDLLRAVAERDDRALAECIRRLSPWLAGVARRAGARGGEIDEVVQDTWVAVVAAIDEYRAAQPLLPWLAAIARHRLVSLRRSQRRRARLHPAGGDVLGPAAESPHDDVVALVRGREVLLAVRRAIDDQPTPYREVLRLHLLEGLQAHEIAQRLQLGRVSVRVRLYRGLRRLRRSLPDALALVLLAALAARAPSQAPLWAGAAACAVLAVAVPWVCAAQATPVAVPVRTAVASQDLAVTSPLAMVADDPVPAASPRIAAAAAGVVVRVCDPSGHGVADVGVIVEPELGGDPLLHERRAATDASGRAVFADLPAVRLRVRCDRGVAAEREHGDPREVVLRVADGRQVRGRVVDAAGHPIAGARIWLAGPGARRDGAEVATTAGDGTFALRAIAPGSLLAVRATGFAGTSMRRIAGGDLGTLVLDRRGGAVAVEVAWPDGRPYADAAIVLGYAEVGNLPNDEAPALSPPCCARTAESGRWIVDGVAPGSLPLIVRAPGMAPFCAMVEVAPDQEARVHVSLQPGRSLTGRVVDGAGIGVADVHLACRADATFAAVDTRSAADGGFRFEALPAGEVGVLVWTADGDVTERVVSLADGDGRIDLQVERRARRRGRIVSTEGEPLAGWQLALPRSLTRSTEDETFDGTADASGRVELATGAGTDWSRLLIRPPTSIYWAVVAERCFDLSDGSFVVRVPPSLRAAGRLTGTARDETGRPLANATIVVAGREAERVEVGATDDEGRFSFDRLPIGDYALSLEAPGPDLPAIDLPEVTIAADETAQVEVVAPPAGRLGYSLQLAGGGRPHAPIVTVTSADTQRRRARLYGAVGEQVLLPGDYVLGAMGDDFVWNSVPVHVVAGRRTDIALDLLPAVRRQFALRHLPVAADDGMLEGRFFAAATGASLYEFRLPLDKAFLLPLTSYLPVGLIGCEAKTTSGKHLRAQFVVSEQTPPFAPQEIPFVVVP